MVWEKREEKETVSVVLIINFEGRRVRGRQKK